ncbi:alginate export family protein [Desulfoglaeba alkanexedens]|uniref:Alginate export domain-containing protein n=1 Tax=Desulfoglaeba alkanexedens ALDC TaxID=980445 RepID=A0A4P8L008_9BACT|nr:alginate export family protein [Desulfoglaeba alkanexedens]QCQ21156.1 hypothetical protein FDQ92_02460 [Desulfoglaeba alkanexedens ALDC]
MSKTLANSVVVLLLFSAWLPVSWADPRLADADPVLTMGAGMRYRYEFQDDFNQKFYGRNPPAGTTDDGFLLGRFRAGIDWYPVADIHVALWGQHAVCWDSSMKDEDFYNASFRREDNPNKDYLELYTTYIEFNHLFAQSLSLRVGRQLVSYGDCRIFGPGEWGNTGRWIWDAAKLSWRFDRGFVDLFYGRTMLHDVNTFSLNHRHGFEGLGGYGHVDLVQRPFLIAFEPTFFTKDDRHDNYTGETMMYVADGAGGATFLRRTGDIDSWYVGGRLYGRDIHGFDFDFTFLREAGDFAGDDLDAYGWHAMVGYHLPLPWKPFATLQYSYASGDDDPADGDHETFSGAFGARDRMYGRMNLFHWRNLKDYEAGLELKPHKKVRMEAGFHKFLLAEKADAWYLNPKAYRDPTGGSGDEVGRELDIITTWEPSPNNVLMAGYGHFWPDEFARKMASDTEADWVFLQWEYTFGKTLVAREN